LQWNRKGDKYSWQLKTAWLDETIDFQDSLILLFTRNLFQTWLIEGESSIRLSDKIVLASGIYVENVQATSANYLKGTSRQQQAVFASLRYYHHHWLVRYQMREERTDEVWSPLLLDLSAEWSGIEKWTLKSSLSRNYRTPTMNDLFWRPGGNPDLVPERGWTVETGLHYRSLSNPIRITSSLTAFNRTMNEWIIWMPPIKDVRNYWSPVNIFKVHSRGFEFRGDAIFTDHDWTFKVHGALDLTWSQFGNALPAFNIQTGDQLFYVPVENLLTGMSINHRQFSGFYHHHWFGASPGINEDVIAGHVGSGGLAYQKEHPKTHFTIYLQVDNAWNVAYRLIERRPMPGRSILGGVRVSFF
jgi:iron complex outermembrane receptor protein